MVPNQRLIALRSPVYTTYKRLVGLFVIVSGYEFK